MKVHVISETEYLVQGNGVHTAFVDHVELLKEQEDISVVVNEKGYGDVFHSHTYGPYYFWKGRHYKGRRVLTVHVIPDSIKGSIPIWQLWYPFVKWYFKQVYSYADVCIAISPFVQKAIVELKANTNILPIYNPIPLERWRRTEERRVIGRERLRIQSNDFVVLGVGQLEKRKGVEDFIDIAAANPDVRFIWVGGRPFGALTAGIRSINELIKNASKNLTFTGLMELKDMPFVYAASDLFLFPSYQENCPLAPLEAAASDIPVIFKDIEEYVSLYKSDYLKAKNNQEFIEFVKKMNCDKVFYKEGVSISRQLVKQFDRTEIRTQLILLYQNLIQSAVNKSRFHLVSSKQ